jgi:hypothetical protein
MKKLLSGLNAFILTLALLVFGLTLSIVSAFNSPQPAKEALASSGIYNGFIGRAVDRAGGSISRVIDFEPEIHDVIVNTAEPYVREDMEKGLDSMFAWIKDPSKDVSFTVDASKAKEPVSKAVGDYVQQMIEKLPVCESIPRGFNPNNPFTWDCQPENTNLATYHEAFSGLISQHRFWATTTFTLDDIAGITEEELTSDYQVIADSYGALVAATWISGILAVLTIATTWLLTRSVRRTLRRVGISFVIASIILIAISITASIVTGQLIAAEFDGNNVQRSIGEVIGNISGVLGGWLLWSGIVGTIIGVIALVGSFLIKGKRMPEPEATATSPLPDTTTQQTPSSSENPNQPTPPTM